LEKKRGTFINNLLNPTDKTNLLLQRVVLPTTPPNLSQLIASANLPSLTMEMQSTPKPHYTIPFHTTTIPSTPILLFHSTSSKDKAVSEEEQGILATPFVLTKPLKHCSLCPRLTQKPSQSSPRDPPRDFITCGALFLCLFGLDMQIPLQHPFFRPRPGDQFVVL
jgi:hypothetical protein